MAKKIQKAKPITKNQARQAEELAGDTNVIKMLMGNSALLRQDMLRQLLNPKKDINYECGYPDFISISEYKEMYDREGIGSRVVDVWPDECWAMRPSIYENEETAKTEFEKEWDDLELRLSCLNYLNRIDIISGIGRFGVLLLGLSDGKALNVPVAEMDRITGELVKGENKDIKLLYMRTFDESAVTISQRETNPRNPRYGFPTMYTLKFEADAEAGAGQQSLAVHWSRVLHIADNKKVSEVYGVPRMQTVYNRLLDIRKVLSGSGEMFWKGGFPGYSFETNPELGDVEVDTESMKDTIEKHMNGLQRYMTLTGVTAKSLQPQVADPRGHFAAHLEAIAISIGIPLRLLKGSEAAKLASTQDAGTWNKRVAKRQNGYCTPMLIRKFIDRLIAFGVLSEPERYFAVWPDLNTPTDEDRAKIAESETRAMGTYVTGGVDTLIAPREYFIHVLGKTAEEAEAILAATEVYVAERPDEVRSSEENNPDDVVR